MINKNNYTGFIKLLSYSLVISIVVVTIALMLSLVHPEGEIVDARVKSESLYIKLKEPWNIGLFGNDIQFLTGVCDENGEVITQYESGSSVFNSLDFMEPLPTNTSINFMVEEDEVVLLIEIPKYSESQETSASDCMAVQGEDEAEDFREQVLLSVVDESIPNDVFKKSKKLYYSFGHKMQLRLSYPGEKNIDSQKEMFDFYKRSLEGGELFFDFPPAAINSIDFPFENVSDSRQKGLTRTIINNMTSLESGDVDFPASPDRNFVVKKGDPIRFFIESGFVQKLQINKNGVNIHFMAKVESVKKSNFNFSEKNSKFNLESISPTLLDKLIRSDFFVLFISILGFIMSMVGLFELLDMRDVFKRNVGMSYKNRKKTNKNNGKK